TLAAAEPQVLAALRGFDRGAVRAAVIGRVGLGGRAPHDGAKAVGLAAFDQEVARGPLAEAAHAEQAEGGSAVRGLARARRVPDIARGVRLGARALAPALPLELGAEALAALVAEARGVFARDVGARVLGRIVRVGEAIHLVRPQGDGLRRGLELGLATIVS